jgi:hypothetical protein
MDDKHDPNAGVPIGTFTAKTDDGQFEIPIEVVADDEIESRQLAFSQPDDPLRFSDEPTRDDALPRRKRVATLLGVPLPGMLPEANDPTKATRHEINAAIDQLLEEQPTRVYGAKREAESSLQSLESLVEAEMVELPASHPPGDIVGVVARESETGTFQLEVREADEPQKGMPVLAPAQFVEARQRDQSAQPMAASALAVSAFEGAPRASASHAKSSREAKAARSEKSAAAAEPAAVPISSLAPREIARSASSRRAEPASAAGIGLVAAMVLLGIGGWWWTAGGYRRMADQAPQPAAAARPVTPPAPSEPLALAKAPSEPAPVVAPPAPTPPPVAPAERKPHVASKTIRKLTPPPAPAAVPAPGDSMAETPSRNDVLNGLDGVRSSVQACAEGRNGVAEVDLTIAANGVVTNALVGGDFGGTPQGSCIARAVRKARFPVFKQDRYRVLFPYIL